MDVRTIQIVNKVTHEVSTVRQGALQSLLSKLNHGILSASDLARDTDLCMQLLKLCDRPTALCKLSVQLFHKILSCREGVEKLYLLDAEEKIRKANRAIPEGSWQQVELNDILYKILTGASDSVKKKETLDGQKQEGDFDLLEENAFTFAEVEASLKGVTSAHGALMFRQFSKLQKVNLQKEDIQILFESCFRMRQSNDEATLLATLYELWSSVSLDFPCEALVHQSVLENIFQILHVHSTENIFNLAICVVRNILRGVRKSIGLSSKKDMQATYTRQIDNLTDEGNSVSILGSYPQNVSVPGDGDTFDFQNFDVVDVTAHIHFALLHLFELLGDPQKHFLALDSILEALKAMTDCRDSLSLKDSLESQVTLYLQALAETIEKCSQMWKNEAAKANENEFKISQIDVMLVHIAIEVFKLVDEACLPKITPPGIFEYLYTIYSNECISLCLPNLIESLVPVMAKINPKVNNLIRESKEILQKFFSISKLLEQLRSDSADSKTSPKDTIHVLLELLPTIIGIQNMAYIDLVLNVYFHLLLRCQCTYLEDGAPDFSEDYLNTILKTFLESSSLQVKQRVYSAWLAMIEDSEKIYHSSFLSPLKTIEITGLLIHDGLQHIPTRKIAAKLVFFASQEAGMKHLLQPWIKWLKLYSKDMHVGPIMLSAKAGIDAASTSFRESTAWTLLKESLFTIYSNEISESKSALSTVMEFLISKGYLKKKIESKHFAVRLPKHKLKSENTAFAEMEMAEIKTIQTIFNNPNVEMLIVKASALQLLFAASFSFEAAAAIDEQTIRTCSLIIAKSASANNTEVDIELLNVGLKLLQIAFKTNARHVEYFTLKSESSLLHLLSCLYHPSIEVQQNASTCIFTIVFMDERSRLQKSGFSFVIEGMEKNPKHFLIPEIFANHIEAPLEVDTVSVEFISKHKSYEEHAAKIKAIMEARRAVQSVLQDQPHLAIDDESTHMVELLHPRIFFAKALEMIKTSSNHDTCQNWMTLLANYCFCEDQLVHNFLDCDWLESFKVLLGSAPSSTRDWTVWLKLFQFLGKVVTNTQLSDSVLMSLICTYKSVIFPCVTQKELIAPLHGYRMGVRQHLQVKSPSSMIRRSVALQSVCSAIEVLNQICITSRSLKGLAVSKLLVDTFAQKKTLTSLVQTVVASSGIDYGAKLLFMEFILHLLECYIDIKTYSNSTNDDVERLFVTFIPIFVKDICIPESNTITRVHSGKKLLKQSLLFLKRITNLDRKFWVCAWSDTDCTFWMSRLLRDYEAEVRKITLQITAILCHPDCNGTLEMVQKHWPDRIYVVSQIAFDRKECDVVRSYAYRVLALAMVCQLNKSTVILSETYRSEDNIKRSMYQLLEERDFWAEFINNGYEWSSHKLMGGMLQLHNQILLSDTVYAFQHLSLTSISKIISSILDRNAGVVSVSAIMRNEVQSQEALENIAPISAAADVIGILSTDRVKFSQILKEVSIEHLCKIYMLICASMTHFTQGYSPKVPRLSYYAALLPVVEHFNKIMAAVMNSVIVNIAGDRNDARSGIHYVTNGIKELFQCEILPPRIYDQCYKLLEILFQDKHLARETGTNGDLKFHSELSLLIIKHIKQLYSNSAGQVACSLDTFSAAILGFKSFVGCSREAKAAMLQSEFYLELIDQLNLHTSALTIASMDKTKTEADMRKKNGQMIMCAMVLLKHFCFESRQCSDALVDANLLEILQRQFDTGNPHLQYQCLEILINLASNSKIACLGILSLEREKDVTTPMSFFMNLFRIWCDRRTLNPLALRIGWLIQALVQAQEARTSIVKGTFLNKIVKLFYKFMKYDQQENLLTILKFMCDLAAFKDSRSSTLNHPTMKEFMSQLLSIEERDSNEYLLEESLLFFRNLAFAPEMKGHVTSNIEILKMILESVYKAIQKPKRSSYASSALWALLYNGQKVKACIRKNTDATNKLLELEDSIVSYQTLHSEHLSKESIQYLEATLASLLQINKILSIPSGNQDLKLVGSPVSILYPEVTES